MKNASAAFTLIEVLLVLVLIGVIFSVLAPRLRVRATDTAWTTIHDNLNRLMLVARQEAIAQRKVHRLVFKRFNDGGGAISIEFADQDSEKKDQVVFKPAIVELINPTYTLPEQIVMQAFYLNKKNIFRDDAAIGYCYIVPDGLCQNIILQLENKEQPGIVSYKLNPFIGAFESYDEAVKPE